MKFIEYISYISIPLMMLIILVFAWKQKREAYELFIDGAKDGLKIILRIFPTMIGIYIAINLFKVPSSWTY